MQDSVRDESNSDGDTDILTQTKYDEDLVATGLPTFSEGMELLLQNEKFWSTEDNDLKTNKFNQELSDYFYFQYELKYSKRISSSEYKYICSNLINKYPKLKETVHKVCEEKNNALLLGKIEGRQKVFQAWVSSKIISFLKNFSNRFSV